MNSGCYKLMLLSFVILITASAFDESLNNLTDRQRSRIRHVRKNNSELTCFERRTKYLFKIIHERPENKDIEFSSCDTVPLTMPDFEAPGRRISEVKCLEYLWTMRYYDESLVGSVFCGKPMVNNKFIQTNFGGYDAVPTEFAHMGAIGWETYNSTWLFLCEGALVSERFMITAAHCSRLPRQDARVSDPKPKVVRFGETNISDQEEIGKAPTDVSIKKIIIYPRYSKFRKYYNIAIVELENEIVFSTKAHPACIWSNLYDMRGTAELTGWNTIESNKTVLKKEFISDNFDVFTRLTLSRKFTNEERNKNDSVNNPVLQLAEVNLMDTYNCDKITKCRRDSSWRGLLFHQLCAARDRVPSNSSDCQVDIGGVLQARLEIPEFSDWTMHYIIGLRSFDFGCDFPLTLSVYTKASVFLDWIEDVVWGED